MFTLKISRLLKYGIYGTVGIGGVALAMKHQSADYNSFTLVRIYRTTKTAIEIGKVYNDMLYKKEWDTKSKEYIELRKKAHEIGADKLLKLCRENRGVYIKVGQHIGALDYLLPSEYVMKMRILHKDAPKNTVEELYKVIREDLKTDPDQIFDEFEEEPLGVASLAQVHRAKLKDGTDVAVKVQHEFVRNHIYIDMKSMEVIIKVLSVVFPEFEMNWLVEETKKNIERELDFLQEGRNAETVKNMFSQYKWLKVPSIHWNYSTSRVLVMDYVSGGLINDLKYIKEHKIDKIDVCSKLGNLYAHMIFVCGFVHSDPHPGNILVSKQPGEGEASIYLLDHGLYAKLTDNFRYSYSKLWLSILKRDRDGMKTYAEQLGIRSDLYFLFACMVSGRPWESILKGVDKIKRTNEEKQIFQEYLPTLFSQITHCLEHMDRQALLVLKTNDLIRSIEFALGTSEQMSGFMTMTKCCIKSIYNIENKNLQIVPFSGGLDAFKKIVSYLRIGLYILNPYSKNPLLEPQGTKIKIRIKDAHAINMLLSPLKVTLPSLSIVNAMSLLFHPAQLDFNQNTNKQVRMR